VLARKRGLVPSPLACLQPLNEWIAHSVIGHGESSQGRRVLTQGAGAEGCFGPVAVNRAGEHWMTAVLAEPHVSRQGVPLRLTGVRAGVREVSAENSGGVADVGGDARRHPRLELTGR
jgi:hypothetical protein